MMRFANLIAAAGLSFSGTVLASQTVIDQQVDTFFAKGMAHCKNAMELSRTSRQVAAAEFDRYQSYIGKVEALKPELKNDIMIKRQMEQCDQVGHDIARADALPVIEEGLAVCKEVKSLIQGDYITKAKARFLEYTQHRNQAVSMTDTVLKVGSNASKIRRCDRLEEKIIAAEQRIHHSEIKADRLLSALRKSNDSCEVTRSMLADKDINEEKLEAAESMLAQSREYFQQTERYPEAINRAENYPGYESSQKIRQHMLEYSRCDQNVVARLDSKRDYLAQQQAKAAARAEQIAKAAVPAQTTPADSIPASANPAEPVAGKAIAATAPAGTALTGAETQDLVSASAPVTETVAASVSSTAEAPEVADAHEAAELVADNQSVQATEAPEQVAEQPRQHQPVSPKAAGQAGYGPELVQMTYEIE